MSSRGVAMLALMFSFLAGASACGGNPSAEKQAAKWGDDIVRAIRSADEEAQAANAVKRVPPSVSDAELERLQKEMDDAIDGAVCQGADILVKALEEHKSTDFDWSGWSAEQLHPSLASDFSEESIDEVGNELDDALDALEVDLPLLKGVATACGIAHSGI